jgi:calcineurin-like phosphoesterase family protein
MFDAYIADTHFGHARIIELCQRPFKDVEEMNRALIDNYNSYITQDMTVAWLGDCFFTPTPVAADIMRQLNGRKVLIWGGHDRSFSAMLRIGFSAVTTQMGVIISGRVCTLSHFPYQGSSERGPDPDTRYPDLRPMKKKGQALIHGHTHQKKILNGTMIHVGVDAWDYKPVMWYRLAPYVEEIFAKATGKQE